MKYSNIILFSFFVGVVQCYNLKYCDDLSPYLGDIDLDKIIGVWYGVEIIPHIEDDKTFEQAEECFHINIRETYMQRNSSQERVPSFGEQTRIRHIILEWHEGMQQVDYHVRANPFQKGFWSAEVPNESMDRKNAFHGGIIQVLKATDNYLVLNFCMKLPYSQLYSVVLARNENLLTPEDLNDILYVFSTKNLSTLASKRVCENSGFILLPNIFMLIIWTLSQFTIL